MPQYLFQGQRDSGGNVGPTLQKMQDRARFARGKADLMEGAANVALPLGAALGTYSSPAEGAILKPDQISTKTIQDILTATKRGARPQDILRDFGMVYDGKNWQQYIPDQFNRSALSDLFASKTPFGTYKDFKGGGQGMTLKDIITNAPKESRDVPLEFVNNPIGKGTNFGGYYTPNREKPIIGLNVRDGRSLNEMLASLSHEGIHPYDHAINRSHGANPDTIRHETLQLLSGRANRPVDKVEAYRANSGERRAEMNAFITAEGPENWRGLQSMYDARYGGAIADPKTFWGDKLE